MLLYRLAWNIDRPERLSKAWLAALTRVGFGRATALLGAGGHCLKGWRAGLSGSLHSPMLQQQTLSGMCGMVHDTTKGVHD